jgi:hypothetical protein
VLKIRKDGLLPEVVMRTPSKGKLIDFRKISQTADI